MLSNRIFWVFVISSVVVAPLAAQEKKKEAPKALPIADLKRDKPVDFEGELLPVFTRSCLACHNAKDHESDLVLETPQTILKGGATGPVVVPGKSGESVLFKVAAHLDDPAMPPADNKQSAKPLAPEELALLKLWIDQGAKGEVKGPAKIAWQPLPPGVKPIYAVAVSSDGQIAATGRANQVFLYHLGSGQELGRLTDPALIASGVYKLPGVADLDLIQSLAFSPDGELLATGGYRTVKLWQRPHNVRRGEIAGIGDVVRSIALSADGKTAALLEASGKMQLVEAATGKAIRTIAGSGAAVGHAFTADGQRIVTAGSDKALRVWNVADGAAIYSIDLPQPALAMVVVGQQAVTADGDNLLRVWEIPKDKPAAPHKPVKELKGHSQPITSLALVSIDGKQVVSGGRDGTMRLWNIAEGRELKQFNHGGPILAVAGRADGKRLVSAGENKSLILWNGENAQKVAEIRGDQRARLAVDRLTRGVASAKARLDEKKKDVAPTEALAKTEADNVKKFTDAKTAAEAALKMKQEALKKPADDKAAAEKAIVDAKAAAEKAKADLVAADKPIADAMAAVQKAQADKTAAASKSAEEKAAADKALAEANKQLMAAQQAKTKAMQAVTQEQNKAQQAEQKLKQVLEPFRKAESELQTAQSAVVAATKAIEASQVVAKRAADEVPVAQQAVAAAEAKVKSLEAELATATKAATDSEQPFKALAMAADGKMFAAAADNGVVQLFGSETGSAVDVFAPAAGATAITSLAIASDGGVLAASAEKKATIWDSRPEWKLVRTIGAVDQPNVLADRVLSLAFSPDGKLLASGSGQPSRSGQLKLWNVADGTLAKEFVDAHSDTVFGLSFSPDGTYLATAAADRFVKIWNVTEGKFVRSFEGHTHHVLGVAWKADGRTLASGGADAAIKIWDFIAGEQKRTINVQTKEVTSIAFVGGGDEMVSGNGDRNVRFYRAGDGGNVRNLAGPDDFIYAVAATDDGKLVVAGGQDSVVRVWTMQQQNGQALWTFEPPAK